MRTPLRFLLIAACIATTAACQTWAKVEPEPLRIADAFSVQPDIVWSALRFENTHHLTVDGPKLQHLILNGGSEDGDPIFDAGPRGDANAAAGTFPAFDPDMSPIELVELVEATFEVWGYERFEVDNVGAATLGGKPGLRFDFDMVSEDGLKYDGKATLAVHEEELHLVIYFGTALYHYDKHLANADRIVNTVEWVEETEGEG